MGTHAARDLYQTCDAGAGPRVTADMCDCEMMPPGCAHSEPRLRVPQLPWYLALSKYGGCGRKRRRCGARRGDADVGTTMSCDSRGKLFSVTPRRIEQARRSLLAYHTVQHSSCNGRVAQWERARYEGGKSEIVGWGQDW